jgi:hypothetical protein
MAVCDRCGTAIPLGARFCPGCGTPVSTERLPEERKLATVLFADLVGSTALAGARDPERTRALLDGFYGAMAEEIDASARPVSKWNSLNGSSATSWYISFTRRSNPRCRASGPLCSSRSPLPGEEGGRTRSGGVLCADRLELAGSGQQPWRATIYMASPVTVATIRSRSAGENPEFSVPQRSAGSTPARPCRVAKSAAAARVETPIFA